MSGWFAWLLGEKKQSKEQEFADDFSLQWHDRESFNPQKQRTWEALARRWNQEQKKTLDWYGWYTKDIKKIENWSQWRVEHPDASKRVAKAINKWSQQPLTLIQWYRMLQSCYDIGATETLEQLWVLLSRKKEFQSLDPVNVSFFLRLFPWNCQFCYPRFLTSDHRILFLYRPGQHCCCKCFKMVLSMATVIVFHLSILVLACIGMMHWCCCLERKEKSNDDEKEKDDDDDDENVKLFVPFATNENMV